MDKKKHPHLTPALSADLLVSLSRRALAPLAWLGGGEGEQAGAACVPPPPSGGRGTGRCGTDAP